MRLLLTGVRGVARACVLAGVVLAGAAAQGGEPEQPAAKDTIFARKILMGSIDMSMDEIETMLAPEGKLELAEAREHADVISIMLMAFPHLFPAHTNQWTPGADRDPATDTFASPDVWTNFGEFYQRAGAASKLAFSASRAKRAADFKPLIGQLRAACNACHAAYLKTE